MNRRLLIIIIVVIILSLAGCVSIKKTDIAVSKQNIQKQPQTINPKTTKQTNSEKSNSQLSIKLESLLKKQFNSSSKTKIKNVSTNNNKIVIQLTGTDNLGPIAIDIALVLNHNLDISFNSVEIKNESEAVIFNKDLFNSYRTGQINDLEFMNAI